MKTMMFFAEATRMLAITCVVLLALADVAHVRGEPKSATVSTAVRAFCGSTPCDESIGRLLGISTNEIMEWKLTLQRDPKTGALGTYRLRCDYGMTVPNKPGIGRKTGSFEREGKWVIKSGAVADRSAVIYELAGAVSLREVSSNVLHILNRDGTLLIGNGGWSYTLNAADYSEKTVDAALARTVPDMSYPISPLATGAVFGVFEGRSPCLGIARRLGITVPESATKAKWRITLFENADTHSPTTYKIEGTLFRSAAREGRWSIARGTKADPGATIYELASTKGEPMLRLLKGDENVLFFVDQNGEPLVGHCEFSYTLNRRDVPSDIAQVERKSK